MIGSISDREESIKGVSKMTAEKGTQPISEYLTKLCQTKNDTRKTGNTCTSRFFKI